MKGFFLGLVISVFIGALYLVQYHVIKTADELVWIKKRELGIEYTWINAENKDIAKTFDQLPEEVKTYLLKKEAKEFGETLKKGVTEAGFKLLKTINDQVKDTENE